MRLPPLSRAGKGEGKRVSPNTTYLLWQARELTLPMTSCSAWENVPCTSLGQHSRSDPVDSRVGEPVPENMSMEGAGPAPHLLYGVMGKGEMPFSHHPSLHVAGELTLRSCSFPSAVALRRLAPAPRLGNTMELAQ